MAKSVLLNDNWEKDTIFPEKLAKLARMAFAASVKEEQNFVDPDSSETYQVDPFSYWDYGQRKMITTPGVTVQHKHMLWQCWSAGTTRKNQEYFKFRAYFLFVNPVDHKGGLMEEPFQVASGQIFHNKNRTNESYDMQLFDATATAELKLARQLLNEGVSVDKLIKSSQTLTRSELENDFTASSKRSSGVSFG